MWRGLTENILLLSLPITPYATDKTFEVDGLWSLNDFSKVVRMAIDSIHNAALNKTIQSLNNDSALRRAIVQELWGLPKSNKQTEAAFDSYFGYYGDQCRQFLANRGRHTSARSHEDIVEVAKLIMQPKPRGDILEALKTSYSTKNRSADEKSLNGTINLTARLMSMIEIGRLQHSFSGQTNLNWDAGTLTQSIRDHFEAPELDEHVKLEKLFIARNFERIGGLKIVWTDNLAEHLRLREDGCKVAVYHHATFLKNHYTHLLPTDLIDETLRTFALLFPQSDEQARKWFRKVQVKEKLDPQLVQCGNIRPSRRQIEEFYYWRDRLVNLKQVFDDAEPKTLGQWWYDRRKRVQWATFWVAAIILILTVFFGLVQSIEGGLQVYKAFVPTKQ